MTYELYIPGPGAPDHSLVSVDLSAVPEVGDYLTAYGPSTANSPACVRVTHVPHDLERGIAVSARIVPR
jgi:hypothetical protein